MKDIVFLSRFQFGIIILFVVYLYLIINIKFKGKHINILTIFFLIVILILIYFANYLRIHGKLNKVIKKLGEISKNLYDDYNLNLNPENTDKIAYLAPMNLSFITIYYINLDRNMGRKEYMENQFKKYGVINYHRISAVDGREMKNGGKVNYISTAKNTNDAEIATTISHMKAIQKAYDDGHEYALILEDDVSLSIIPYMKKSLLEIINDLPKDWSILVLSSTCNFSQDVSRKKCYSAEAYLINRKGMENICKYISITKGNLTEGDKIYHITPIKKFPFKSEGASDVYLYSLTPTYFYKEKLFFNSGTESVIHKERDIHSFFNTFQKVKEWGKYN